MSACGGAKQLQLTREQVISPKKVTSDSRIPLSRTSRATYFISAVKILTSVESGEVIKEDASVSVTQYDGRVVVSTIMSARGYFQNTFKKKLFTNGSVTCAVCGIDLDFNTCQIDHKLPALLGGLSQEDNLQPICKTCHVRKTGGDKAVMRSLEAGALMRSHTDWAEFFMPYPKVEEFYHQWHFYHLLARDTINEFKRKSTFSPFIMENYRWQDFVSNIYPDLVYADVEREKAAKALATHTGKDMSEVITVLERIEEDLKRWHGSLANFRTLRNFEHSSFFDADEP